jgi:hypothetical protein
MIKETARMILCISQKGKPIVGYLNRFEFFNIIAQIRAIITPIRVDPKKTLKKVIIPFMTFSKLISLPLNFPSVEKRTIATESFKILSPKIIANNLGSTYNY